MSDNSIGDLPPVWIPGSESPPMQVAKFFMLGREQEPAIPGSVAFALVGRPDDAGSEPVRVVAVAPDLAEELALSLIRVAADVRRAQ